MENRIIQLPERVANQIAAGEVVNHPASVVKEMMENAIDAKATEVIVNYRKAGYDLIQIVDNGVGMSPIDARMAFARHATSKISDVRDIYALRTFGFRGEALASIAAVARVELKSRRAEAEMGMVTVVDGGRFVEQKPDMCDVGSQFFVRNIFENIPARRRFLERESKSATAIKAEFRRVALCYPDVSFELYGDDAPVYRLRPSSLAGRIVDVVGRTIKSRLLEVSADTVIVKIHGYVGHPESAKKINGDQYMFVNGRFFKSSSLFKAVLKGYEKIIVAGTSPAFFLFFEVSPDALDVNVHPQKTEVKFADEGAVWQILNAAVREALARTGVVSMMEFDDSGAVDIPAMEQGAVYAEPRAISNEGYNPFELEESREPRMPSESDGEVQYVDYEPAVESKSKPRSAPKGSVLRESAVVGWESGFDDVEFVEASPAVATNEWSDMEWEGVEFESKANSVEPQQQLELSGEEPISGVELSSVTVTGGVYAWCRIGANMSVVDLRRAKERVLYDHYMASLSGGDGVSQKVLFPIVLQLSDVEYSLMADRLAELVKLGFEIDLVGGGDIEVAGLPADVSTEMVDGLIAELLQLMATPDSVEDQRRDAVAQVMARSAAKSIGRALSPQQAKEIITQLIHGGNVARTAAGKRIMWQVTSEDIRKRLG